MNEHMASPRKPCEAHGGRQMWKRMNPSRSRVGPSMHSTSQPTSGTGPQSRRGCLCTEVRQSTHRPEQILPSWFKQHCESPSNECLRIQYQKVSNTKCWRGRGETETFVHGGRECKMVRPVWKTVRLFLKRFNMDLPYDPASPLLGVDPREPKMYICSKTWTHLFRAAELATTQMSIS